MPTCTKALGHRWRVVGGLNQAAAQIGLQVNPLAQLNSQRFVEPWKAETGQTVRFD
ncbi:hypothetical protein [Nodosilinea sp. E11]|uniref:hypothetical protein n=1 Tax=Nodosilinea sp. E11 TaxID=3037479 RepID=UPI002934855A|nr:hypothetical protein [Nodosilinea sp. E11]WOD40141.1 hypothetical protein RRF56_04975 [Nodosilinea sp. E11]